MNIASVDPEAAPDLVRARQEFRGDLLGARHRPPKLSAWWMEGPQMGRAIAKAKLASYSIGACGVESAGRVPREARLSSRT